MHFYLLRLRKISQLLKRHPDGHLLVNIDYFLQTTMRRILLRFSIDHSVGQGLKFTNPKSDIADVLGWANSIRLFSTKAFRINKVTICHVKE